MDVLSLNGKYNLTVAGTAYNCLADVPGSDFGNLIKYCNLQNPLTAADLDAVVTDIEKANCTFERSFDVSADMLNYSNVVINVDCIDTVCRCYINGNLAFASKNAHLPVEYDIKHLLVVGSNTITFKIESAVTYVTDRQQQKHLPKNSNGTDGAAYLRKPACHFGWDWGPCVPYKYLGNVNITAYNKNITDISINQKIDGNNAVVTVNCVGADDCYIITPAGDKITSSTNEFVINNPQLWYSWDISESTSQPLYTVVISNAETTVKKRIGIRQIKLNRASDEYGNNFQFVLNGKRVFGKGASVIPFAAIPEDADDSTVDYYLDLCIKAGFNMIRIWGGGDYANEYLLNRCDELGIMVWQDFCYACLMYPFYEKDFYTACVDEAVYNVKRITLHPCLALWCGNNELEAMFSYLPQTNEIVKAYINFFYTQLPNAINGLTDVDYIPSSPLGDKPFSKNSADDVGDTHMWNVWHGLKPLNYYEKRYTRFMSEFGLESLPSMTAIKTFAKPSEFDLKSNAFMSHQKCTGGNEKMMFYLKERFDTPVNFDDLPYLTGIVQADCVKSAAEHFRRNKGRCNGALFWQLNDVWCCPSWSSVDFMGVPKALMYKASKFFAPVCVTYNNGTIYAHNDTMFNKNYTCNITVVNGDNVKLNTSVDVDLPADSVSQIYFYTLQTNDVLKVSLNGTDFYFDAVEKLQNAKLNVSYDNGDLVITANKYVRNVFVDVDTWIGDNYFNLLAGEQKRIAMPKPGTLPTVKCENNIEFSKNKVKTAISQAIYRLKPANIANAFYYEHN